MKKRRRLFLGSGLLKNFFPSLMGRISSILIFPPLWFLSKDSGRKKMTKNMEIRLIPAAKKKGVERLIFDNTPPISGPKIRADPNTALEYPKYFVRSRGSVTSLI
jgi:hypothetical protein